MAHPRDFGTLLKSDSYTLLLRWKIETIRGLTYCVVRTRIIHCASATFCRTTHGRTGKTWLRAVKLHPEDQKLLVAE